MNENSLCDPSLPERFQADVSYLTPDAESNSVEAV